MVTLTKETSPDTITWKLQLPNLLLVCAGGVFVIVILMKNSSSSSSPTIPSGSATSSLSSSTTSNLRSSENDNTNRIGRRIFIDLGANCGKSYWRAKQGKGMATEETLKLPTPEVWETYLWECNPKLVEWYLNDIAAKEPNVTIIPKAAHTFTGTTQLYLTAGQENLTAPDPMYNPMCEVDSDYQPNGASTLYKDALRAGTSIEVETLDFVAWHKSLNLQDGDSVHIKLDIEGAEVDILELMIHDKSHEICYWDVVWIEYHKEIFEIDTEDQKKHTYFEHDFPKMFEIKCLRKLYPNAQL